MIERVIELKNPGAGLVEGLTVALDFSDLEQLEYGGQQIGAAALSQVSPPDNALTLGSPTIIASGRVVSFKATPGTVGNNYEVLCKVTLSGGDVRGKTVLFRVIAT